MKNRSDDIGRFFLCDLHNMTVTFFINLVLIALKRKIALYVTSIKE